MRIIASVLLAGIVGAPAATAAVAPTPPAAKQDPSQPTKPTPGTKMIRMTTAAYDPQQVYAVSIPQGQSFAIILPPSEVVTDVFGGDKDVLKADVAANTVMLWTGGVVVTPRTVFIHSRKSDGKTSVYPLLVESKPPADAGISLTFTNPGEDAAKRAAAWQAGRATREQKAAEIALATAAASRNCDSPGLNQHYVLQGSTREDWNLLPTRQVCDDGKDTFLHFPGNMRVPLIYVETADGKREAVTNYTFNSQTGIAVVHRLAPVFHLRDGDDSMLCVYNKAYDPVGVKRSPDNMITPDVERVLK